jgi:hypothetical protein
MDPEVNSAHKQLLSADQRRRNEVEGCFGSGKRKDSLKLIMPRLAKGAVTSISKEFLVMCAEKIRRLLRIIYITVFAWVYIWLRPSCLWMVFRNFCLIETTELLVTE